MSKLVGRARRVPGLSLFSLDTTTGEIVNLGQDCKRIEMKKGCVYRQALNKKNFIKHLIREGILKVTTIKKDEDIK